MNSMSAYPEPHPPPLSNPPSHITSSAPPLGSYPSYHQAQMIQPSHHQGGYPTPHSGTYAPYPYPNGVSPTQSAGHHPSSHGVPSQHVPLPAMPGGSPGSGSSPNGAPYGHPHHSPYDTTGQIGPPGVKPRVTATLWEDEGSLCFQVEAKGVCVARREDNHFINGTKLLNVAGMTRGRRDGILKSEKTRHVVKIGPMHLKGVWIPFERALDFANKEKITDVLYPLFVHDIGALLYHPTNQSARGGHAALAAVDQRRRDPQQRYAQAGPQQHQHPMNPQQPLHVHGGRPSLDRANTFPTPPTSASSLMGVGNSSSYNEWAGGAVPNIHSSQPLQIDTNLSNHARSVPTTPATTPPGAMQNVHPYQSSQSYDTSRQMYNCTPTHSAATYRSQYGSAYGQPMASGSYQRPEMPAPAREADSQTEHKPEQHSATHGDEEADHEHEAEYAQSATQYGARASYSYGAPAIHSDHPHLSPEITGSPSHQPGSGRATPRTSTGHPQSWPSNYSTQQRSAGSNLYNVITEPRATSANGTTDNYPPPSAVQSTYSSQPYITNGTTASNKRMREDDDEADPYATPSATDADGRGEADGLKRRKTTREDSLGGVIHDGDTVSMIGRPRASVSSRRQ